MALRGGEVDGGLPHEVKERHQALQTLGDESPAHLQHDVGGDGLGQRRLGAEEQVSERHHARATGR